MMYIYSPTLCKENSFRIKDNFVPVQDTPLRRYFPGEENYVKCFKYIVENRCSRQEAYEAVVGEWFSSRWRNFHYDEIKEFLEFTKGTECAVISHNVFHQELWRYDEPLPTSHAEYHLMARLLYLGLP